MSFLRTLLTATGRRAEVAPIRPQSPDDRFWLDERRRRRSAASEPRAQAQHSAIEAGAGKGAL